jgi:hypothetical protein
MNNTYDIVNVSPELLFPSPYEPKSRTEPSGAHNALKRSIQELGLLYPPLVTRKAVGEGYVIADGHRRVEAIKALAWPSIPVLVTQGRTEELFSATCGTTKAVSAIQWLEVHLHGGSLPSGPTKSNINRIEATVGREFLQELLANGLSPQIWSVANRAIRYMELDDNVRKDVLWWLAKNKLTRQVSAWIAGDNPVQALREAFNSNRAPTLSGQKSLKQAA